MKKMIFILSFCVTVTTSFSQPIPPQSIQDSVLGWMKVYKFKGVNEGLTVDNKVYSARQISICDSFANWMQASYMPKGGLGDVKKTVSEKLGNYNQNTAALPQSYGTYAKTYTFLKYNSKGKMIPENSLGLTWTIMANAVPGWEIRDISNPAQYYFTMPSFENQPGGDETKKFHDLTNNPNLKRYINFWIKNIEAGGGTDYILLSKNNQPPFIKLTKGEYFQALEAAIPRFRESEKKKIQEGNPGNQRTIDYLMKALDEKIERFRTGLTGNREKYKNRLHEPALTNAQPGLNDLDNGRDIFSSGYLSDKESTTGRIPVYKVDAAMAELCKKDKPQWIVASWWWSPHDPVEKYMHESIINNFNFDYVYNFFFDPEKVKGQPYKPLRSPHTREAEVMVDASEASKKNATDMSVHFFEDFSATPVGKKPIGWRNSLGSDGSSSVIAHLDGLDGNWALIRDYSITATQLKKPFPPNFTLCYDVVAAQNFTWGAKGLTFQLSNEKVPGNAESYLKIRLRPGYDGKAGELILEPKFASPGYLNSTKWLDAPGFSNNKKNNHITVTVKKKEEMLQIFIDKIKVAEYEKAIPAALLFNAISFSSFNSGENDKFYIGNIKITKD